MSRCYVCLELVEESARAGNRYGFDRPGTKRRCGVRGAMPKTGNDHFRYGWGERLLEHGSAVSSECVSQCTGRRWCSTRLPRDRECGHRDARCRVGTGTISMQALFEGSGGARFLDGLADLGRLLIFDRCGIGPSDPPTDSGVVTFAHLCDDVEAVVAAAQLSGRCYRQSAGGAGRTHVLRSSPGRRDLHRAPQPVGDSVRSQHRGAQLQGEAASVCSCRSDGNAAESGSDARSLRRVSTYEP